MPQTRKVLDVRQSLLNIRSIAGDRGGSPGAVVPIRLMLVVIVVNGILAWCNVEYTFAFVDRYMSGSLGMRLLGSYLPHAIGLLVCVLGLVMCYGRLSPRELGLSLRGLLVALPIALSFWTLIPAISWQGPPCGNSRLTRRIAIRPCSPPDTTKPQYCNVMTSWTSSTTSET
jgi:hypothetical protein